MDIVCLKNILKKIFIHDFEYIPWSSLVHWETKPEYIKGIKLACSILMGLQIFPCYSILGLWGKVFLLTVYYSGECKGKAVFISTFSQTLASRY